MNYFNRLTDIITCNLSELLHASDNKEHALDQILQEIGQGLHSAERSLGTAERNLKKIELELQENQTQMKHWETQAMSLIKSGKENEARTCLIRKKEAQYLDAGLTQQRDSALATRDHLMTTYRALQARLADAERRKTSADNPADEVVPVTTASQTSSHDDIEAELEMLKHKLNPQS
jgi:phage shock protein A